MPSIRLGSFGAALLLSMQGFLCVAGTAPKRVLILDSFGRDVSPFVAAVSAFRTTLAEELGEPVDFYEVSLDLGRFGEAETEDVFVDFLKSRFEHRPLDLVVPFGAPAAQFTERYWGHVFEGVPVVFTGVDPRMVSPGRIEASTLVTQKVNLPGIVEDILEMRPDTTDIAVVFGSSRLEKFWVAECRREFERFRDRVRFTWLVDRSFDDVLKRSSALPPHTFLLFGMFVMDSTGVPFENEEALRRLHAAANAPVFGYFASELGLGAIGGHLYQDTEVGVRGARVAVRILHGERAEAIAPQMVDSGAAAYDERELRRWGIDAARLPAGSIVRFREPTFWELYRWRAIAVAVFCLAQTALIIGLALNRTRRRRAEIAARMLHGRLISAHEDERARLARELHDDVSQRLARLAIDAAQAERQPSAPAAAETMGGVREGLVTLSEDIHSLSYQLHPSMLEDLGLVASLEAECERFARQQSIEVEKSLEEIPVSVPDETVLCLFRVAQEALRNVARHAKARAVKVALLDVDRGLQLTIGDDGVGFGSGRPDDDPHLGLASMRERVELVGGKFEIESAPGHGTTITAWVPTKEKP